MADLRAQPPRVFFDASEEGQSFATTVTVLNSGRVSKKIKIVQPASDDVNVFIVGSTNSEQWMLAPGMTLQIRVEFLYDGQAMLSDVVKLMSPENNVLLEIPLELRLPAPVVVYPATLDFGSLLQDGRQHTRTLELRNDGNLACDIEVVADRPPFRVRVGRGTLGCTQDTNRHTLKIDFVAAELGRAQGEARVLVDGMHHGTIAIVAAVQDQQLQFLAPDAASSINHVDIGCTHYNTTRTLTAVLFNSSPDPCPFLIEPEEQCAWTHVGGGRAVDEAHSLGAFTCSTNEGILQPREKRIIEFTFHPSHPPLLTGFKTQTPVPPRRDFEATFVARGVSDRRRAHVALTGSALVPAFSLSETLLDFGECAVGEQKTITFRLINDCQFLPLSFSLERVAHFTFSPPAALLLPGMGAAITATCFPRQLGSLSRKATLALAQDTIKLPLELSALCAVDEGLQQRTRAHALTAPTTSALRPFRFGLTTGFTNKAMISSPDGKQQLGLHATARPGSRSAPISNLQTLPDLSSILTADELAAKNANKDKYQSYLKTRRLDRLTTSGSRDDGVDLGLAPAGIHPPTLQHPAAAAAAASPARASASAAVTATSASAAKASPATKNRTVSSTTRRSTLDTLRSTRRADVPTILAPKDLAALELQGPRAIDFGVVCHGSTNATTLTLTNPLDRPVVFALKNDCPELAQSGPKRATIEPGDTLTITVVLADLTHDTVSPLHQAVSYTLNNAHTVTVPVDAVVVAPQLVPSPAVVDIDVTALALCPHYFSQLTLHNPYNCVLDFALLPGLGLRIEPSQGTVGAQESLTVLVVADPSFAAPDASVVRLRTGDHTQEIAVNTRYGKPRGVTAEQRVTFGSVSVGTATRAVTLRNSGLTDAFFDVASVQCRMPGVVVSVEPTRSLVPARGETLLHVTAVSQRPIKFDGIIAVAVRGAASLSIGFSGQFEVPLITVAGPPSVFGGVHCGAHARSALTLTNAGRCAAAVLFDLTKAEDFSIVLPADASTHSDERRAQAVSLTDISSSATPSLLNTLSNRELGDHIQHLHDAKMLIDKIRAMKDFAAKGHFVPGGLDEYQREIRQLEARLATLQRQLDLPTPVHRGFAYRVDVPAGASRAVFLEFAPTQVAAYDFELAVTTGGVATASRRVTATALAAPLLLSGHRFDFGRYFLAGQPAPEQTLELLASGREPIHVSLRRSPASSCFGVKLADGQSATDGVLVVQPKEKVKITLTFDPQATGHFTETIDLFVDSKPAAYASLVLAGWAVAPYLTFSEAAVRLPIVPLGVPSSQIIFVRAFGYGDQPPQLRAALPALFNAAPVEVLFPEGAAAGAEALPVIVSVTSDVPVSFDVPISFYDDRGAKFEISVAANVGDSLLSVYPYLARVRSAYYVPAEADYSPENYMLRVTSAAGRWLSVFGLAAPQPVTIPASLTANASKLAFDIVRHLSGEAIPGLPLVHPRTPKPGQHLSMCAALLRYLTSRGAQVSDIGPELLLPPAAFRDWRAAHYASLLADGLSNDPATVIRRQLLEDTEARLPELSSHAWSIVCLQILRVFALARITIDALRRALSHRLFLQSGSASLSSEALVVLLQGLTIRGIHSPQENILLHWLSICHRHVTGGRAFVENFGEHLADGTVLASALASYAPYLSEKYFRDLFMQARDNVQRQHNALRVVAALRDLQLPLPLEPADIVSPNPVLLVLVVAELFARLPACLPQGSPVVFEARLQQTVSQVIELQNPTDKPLVFVVHLHGSPQFRAADRVTVAPKAKGRLAVDFVAKFSGPARASLLLLGPAHGGGRATVLAFELAATVAALPPPASNVERVPCYSTETLYVGVHNPFAVPVVFTAVLTEVASGDEKRLVRAQGLKLDEISRNPDPFTRVAGRAAMWLHDAKIALAPGESTVVPVQFCPTRLGLHTANIVFHDQRAGEVAVALAAVATLPVPQAMFTFRCLSPCPPCAWHIDVPIANALKDAALCAIPGALAPLLAATSSPATAHSALMTGGPDAAMVAEFDVVVTGPPGFHIADRLLLPPGQPSHTGSIFVPAVNRSTLMRPAPTTALDFVFSPTRIGCFTADAVLTCADDIRVYRIVVDVSEDTIVELSLAAAVFDSVTCDYALSNDSDMTYSLHLRLVDADPSLSVPSAFTLLPRSSAPLPLAFHPMLPGSCRASLVLINTTTGLETHFDITAEAYLSEAPERVVISGVAGEPLQHKLLLSTSPASAVSADILLAGLAGVTAPEIVALGPDAENVSLTLDIDTSSPRETLGSVYVVAPSQSICLAFEIELRIQPMPPTRRIPLRCVAGQRVSASVPVANTTDAAMECVVAIVGPRASELATQTLLSLAPQSQAVLVVEWAACLPGLAEAEVHMRGGAKHLEFALLELECMNPAPIPIAGLACPFGASAITTGVLHNPFAEPLHLVASCSAGDFVVPAEVVVPPKGEQAIDICFEPSVPGPQTASVIYTAANGYAVTLSIDALAGPPAPPPAKTVAGVRGNRVLTYVEFTNLRRQEVRLALSLTQERPDFTILLRVPKLRVPPRETMHVPFQYIASGTAPLLATLTLAEDPTVFKDAQTFTIPLLGLAEIVVPTTITVAGPCGTATVTSAHVALPELAAEADTVLTATVVLPDTCPLMDDQLTATAVVTRAGSAHVTLTLAPQRPAVCSADLILRLADGLQWRLSLRVVAREVET